MATIAPATGKSMVDAFCAASDESCFHFGLSTVREMEWGWGAVWGAPVGVHGAKGV